MAFLRVSVDGSARAFKNLVAVGPDDRARLAESIRTGRARLDLTRVAFARAARISTNTLRKLETARHEGLPDHATLTKVADLLETTPEALYLGPAPIPPADPILAGLYREDLAIARAYHEAPLAVKTTVHRLLQGALTEAQLATVAPLIGRLLALDAETAAAFDRVLASIEAGRTQGSAPGAHGVPKMTG
jgi:transcriptional regulator with XRE-family HTH domain